MDVILADAPRPFVLLDRVDAPDAESLRAARRLQNAPFWHIWEAGAQCAALHQRWRCGFARHAFLLGMAQAPTAVGWRLSSDGLCGELRLTARLRQQGDGAALYALEAIFLPTADAGRAVRDGWEVRIGLCAYDARFRGDILRPRYEELFRCLCRG